MMNIKGQEHENKSNTIHKQNTVAISQEHIACEKWQAIILNDASYDGAFFYGVKTTGIFCRPSCKSRTPKKENVRVFQNAEQALLENFRPCK